MKTESVGVNDVVLTKPTGWVVSYADEVLTIKAPAEEAVCETEGEIAVIYFGDNDRSSLVKMKVKIDKDYTGVTEGDNFTLEITEVGDTRVRAAITPKDPEMSYYVYPYDPAKSDEACITQLQKRFKADIADGPEYVDYFFKGTKTDYRYSGLTPGRELRPLGGRRKIRPDGQDARHRHAAHAGSLQHQSPRNHQHGLSDDPLRHFVVRGEVRRPSFGRPALLLHVRQEIDFSTRPMTTPISHKPTSTTATSGPITAS